MMRFRFSVRTLAVVVTLICLVGGAPISYVRFQASRQRAVLARLKEMGITPYWSQFDWRAPSWGTKQVRYWIDADAFQHYSNVGIPADVKDLDEAIGLIAQLHGLEGVSCGSPNLGEKQVRALMAIPGLNKLGARKANLSPEFVRELINDRQWQELGFSEIPFDDGMLADLRQQKELTRLFFDASEASAPAVEALADCPKLRFIAVYRCRCAGALARIARKMPKLRDLNLAHSNISAEEMEEFADVGSLRELHFDRCTIDPEAGAILTNSPGMDWLQFYKSPVSPATMIGIVNHPAMEDLVLDGPFTDADAEWLGQLPVISSVAFVSCELTDAGLLQFAKAKTLKSLILPKETKCTVEGIRRLQAKLPIEVYVGDLGAGCILGEATVYEPGGVVRKQRGK
jgi:hypothetical protein